VKVWHARCAVARLCPEVADRVAGWAVPVFGGRGYLGERRPALYRGLRAGRVWEGTSEIQRVIITGRVVNRAPGVLA